MKQSEAELRQLLQLNQDNHNICHMIQILVLLAMVWEKQARKDEALGYLKQAVALAAPGGWIRPFTELGPPMADILTRLAAEEGVKGYVGTLIAAFDAQEAAVVPDAPEHDEGKSTASSMAALPKEAGLLTQREIEILAQVAEGLSNKEIAAKLFLSTETVKKHLYNAYQKLEVDSRITALAQARSLGILPAN